MKAYFLLTAFLLFSIFSSVSLQAQNDREDVVYLKNGGIYRGTIIEQVPGQSLKIETVGGNVFSVQLSEVTKFAKEKKVMPQGPPPAQYGGGDMHGEHYYHDRYAARDTHARPQFHYKRKGYFFQAQLLAEIVEGGVRIVNGYKFGRLGYLGIGIGLDELIATPSNYFNGNSDFSGTYFPIYLHYSGDILKKRITPFYSIEAGYAFRMNNNNSTGMFPFDNGYNSGISHREGGMMGGAAFGVKFNSRKKVFFSLSLHMDFKQAKNHYNYNYYNGNYNNYTDKTTLIIPGLRFGLGF